VANGEKSPAFSAISSFMLNFSATVPVGLATQTTNCEWISESVIEGASTAVSAVVSVPPAGEDVKLPDGSVAALAIKNTGGDQCDVSLEPGFSVRLVPGASFAFSGRIPSGTVRCNSIAGTSLEIVAIVGS
jgi:hypothetical protein